MLLIHALHKSPLRAAILAMDYRVWNYVIVEWGPHLYTTEMHLYDLNGDLNFQVVGYQKVNEQQLRAHLGDKYYFSKEWKSYETPTPAKVQGQKRRIRGSRPPKRKRSTHDGYEQLLRELFS